MISTRLALKQASLRLRMTYGSKSGPLVPVYMILREYHLARHLSNLNRHHCPVADFQSPLKLDSNCLISLIYFMHQRTRSLSFSHFFSHLRLAHWYFQ